jgi:hypothetical protein
MMLWVAELAPRDDEIVTRAYYDAFAPRNVNVYTPTQLQELQTCSRKCSMLSIQHERYLETFELESMTLQRRPLF